MRNKYVTVKIPYELATRLEAILEMKGYWSRAEMVNDAIRRFIDSYEQFTDSLHAKRNKNHLNHHGLIFPMLMLL